jgi:hypothetical protein
MNEKEPPSMPYPKWPHASSNDLRQTLVGDVKRARALALFDEFQETEMNDARCAIAKRNVFRNLAAGELVGIKDQLHALPSCGDHALNYIAAKVIAKSEEFGGPDAEARAVNYYRDSLDGPLVNSVPLWDRVKVFHDVERTWIFPIYAGFLRMSPTVFRHAMRQFGKIKNRFDCGAPKSADL